MTETEHLFRKKDGTRTDEKRAIDYTAIGHSVQTINCMISHSADEEKKECVSANVTLLEQMVAKTDWGSEDMTDANKAITDGKAYVG